MGNRTYIALLMLVPVVNIAMPFVLGAKGSAWAWRNEPWDSAAHVTRVQRLWAVWGLVALVGSVALFAGIYPLVSLLLARSEPYKMGVDRLQNDASAAERLGKPIAAGTTSGSISVQAGHGDAELDFGAVGSKNKGTVHLKAVKEFGQWRLTSARLKVDGQDEIIDMMAAGR